MSIKTSLFAGLVIGLTATAFLSARATTASVSPVPEMPAEWFMYEDEAAAAPHRELIGKPAPPIKVAKWFQGEVTPESMKGKIVILDFWATWCAPCKVAMPHGDELAKKYRDQGVVYATICSEGDEAEVTKFIAAKKLSLPMAWDADEGATFKAFRGTSYPLYVAIDRKGVIRAMGLTPDAVEKVIQKLLEEGK